jgi:hypothetical protein
MSEKGKKPGAVFPIVLLILIAIVFCAGCSDQADQGSPTPVPATVSTQPKFVTGDIIAKTGSSANVYWLILHYDVPAGTYERALVTKKPDGSWSRMNDQSESADRVLVEKVYPARVDHVSSLPPVPVEAGPAVSAAVPTENIPLTSIETRPATPGKKPEKTTVSTTAATSADPPPVILSVSDTPQNTHTTFAARGSGFQSGSTVILTRSGYPDVVLSQVGMVSGSEIDFGVFNIPCNDPPGKYTVVVTNPDGRSASLENAVEVLDCKNGLLGDICGRGIYVDNGKVKTDCGVH